MRIVFFGIYDLGRAALETLAAAGMDLVGVVTKPRSPGERQAVAEWTALRHLPLFEPTTPRTPEFLEQIQRLAPDLLVVAGYHRIIPASVLEVPSRYAINLHGSLLPAYRGPSPWKQVILAGETRTGVTVHVMTPELDSGDILAQAEVPIGQEDTSGSLFRKICDRGAALLAETVRRIGAGPVARIPQDVRLASYFGYPSEQQTRISWSEGADHISRLVRAMCPRPGAWTELHGTRLRIWHASRCRPTGFQAEPGTVLAVGDEGLKIATGTDPVIVDQLSVEGDGRLTPFRRHGIFRIQAGDQLTTLRQPDASAGALA